MAIHEGTTAASLEATQRYHDESSLALDALQIEKHYGEERAKRLREDANDQFVDIALSDNDRYRRFVEDPFADAVPVRAARDMFPDSRCEVLILGAGFAGLLYVVRMVEAGVRPEDIRIVDTAAGWGGTWYWNRYPGLECDVESYSYLPLLEETGFIPKHRYSKGEEIRGYINLVAQKWGVANSAVFQTRANKMVWDDSKKRWHVELEQERKGEQPQTLDIQSSFVVMASGVLSWPKLPGIPGILDFKGDMFHTSRWDYSKTGGTPADPSLTKLQDKRVAIIGTGATAVQAVPHLAAWAKHLYVVQRTPSAVGFRGQRETDEDWFRKEVATGPGWQRERIRNFHGFASLDNPPKVDLVNDGWTNSVVMAAITGSPDGPKTMEELQAYERLRRQTEEIVKVRATAKKLQAWYPSWCKRLCFNDEYHSCFNRPNVTLVDTEGKGLDKITSDSIVSGDESFPVDIIIFATGFRAPFIGSPAEKANMKIYGINGVSMTEEWGNNGPSTQHGVLDKNFPNLFLWGPWQIGFSPNSTAHLGELAKHCAYIVAEAKAKAQGRPVSVKTTAEAAEEWTMQIMAHAIPTGAAAGCTPNYFNVEGALDRLSPEKRAQFAKAGVWGHGIEDFVRRIEAWRAEGNMRGVEVQF